MQGIRLLKLLSVFELNLTYFLVLSCCSLSIFSIYSLKYSRNKKILYSKDNCDVLNQCKENKKTVFEI